MADYAPSSVSGQSAGDRASGLRAIGQQIAVPEQLVAAWDRAVEKWDDPAAHDEVLRLAGVHDSFAWVAGRYCTRPEDKIRDAQLERLRKAAEVTMYATAAQRPEKASQRYRGLAIIVVMIALASALLYLIVRMRANDEPKPTAPTTEKKTG